MVPPPDPSSSASATPAETPQHKSTVSSSASPFDQKTNDGPSSSSSKSPNFIPIYLSDSSLEKFSMKKGTGVTEIVEWKIIKLAQIKSEISANGENSDFYEFRELFGSYEGESVLFIKGPENEFEWNYKFSATQDAYEDAVKTYVDGDDGGEDGMGVGSGEDEDGLMSPRKKRDRSAGRERDRYKRADAGDDEESDVFGGTAGGGAGSSWVEHTTEQAIQLEHVKSHRPLLGYFISQPRYKFGRTGSALDFSDVEPSDKLSEYGRQKIPNYSLNRSILHVGFQAAAEMMDAGAQTEFRVKLNKTTQSEPNEYNDEKKRQIMESAPMNDFIFHSGVLPRLLSELHKNAVLDLFKDEFQEFQDEEVNLGNRAENAIEILHSFHHLKYSKNRFINWIQWLPSGNSSTLGLGIGFGANSGSNGVGGAAAAGSTSVSTTGAHSSTSSSSAFPSVAFSAAPALSFDEWVDQSGKMNFSSILIYSLRDLLHPQLVLEIPGNIECFQIHPQNSDWVIAGLQTGQVLFFDLTEARNRLEEAKLAAKKQKANKNGSGINVNPVNGNADPAAANGQSAGSEGVSSSTVTVGEDSSVALPVIRYTYISYIDRSHSRPVSDLFWLPADKQLTRRGEYYTSSISTQFASIAADGRWMCWDFKNRNEIRAGGGSAYQYAAEQEAAAKALAEKRAKDAQGNNSDPINTPEGRVVSSADSTGNTSQNSSGTVVTNPSADADVELKEIKWAPTFVLPLNRAGNASAAASAFGGASATPAEGGESSEPAESPSAAASQDGKPSLPVLSGPFAATKMHYYENNTFVMVSEDGEVGMVDTAIRGPAGSTQSESDRISSPALNKAEPVLLSLRGHLRPAVGIDRSPHFPNIFLTVGDWSFSIWQIGVHEPIFTSSPAPDALRCARFSPTRPGLIVTGRSDGSIDVWDFCDQTHKPTTNFQTGTSDAIDSLEFHSQTQQMGNSTYFMRQYLAAGDQGGKLHIIEMPRNLRRRIHGEEQMIKEFYAREMKRQSQKGKARKAAMQSQAMAASAAAKANQIQAGAASASPAVSTGPSPSNYRSSSEVAEDDRAEKEYQAMLKEFREKLAKEGEI